MKKAVVSIPSLDDLENKTSKDVGNAISALNFRFTTDPIEASEWKSKKIMITGLKSSEFLKFTDDVTKTLSVIAEFTDSEARTIKNRRNLLRNIGKTAIAVHYSFLGEAAALKIGHAIATKAAGSSLTILSAKAISGILGKSVGYRAGEKAGDTVVDVSGMIYGFFSNSIRLQNRVTNLYNNATNGVVDTMIDHINLGWGFMERVLDTLDY